MEISVPVPHNISFKRTALSHGWYGLLPFEFDQQSWTLRRVIDMCDDRPITVSINSVKQALFIHSRRRLGKRAEAKVVGDVRHMLRLDEDLSEFYDAMTRDEGFAWVEKQGAGRLLRSPTVYED